MKSLRKLKELEKLIRDKNSIFITSNEPTKKVEDKYKIIIINNIPRGKNE